MSSFVSQIPQATTAQMLSLAVGINAALRGDTANIGTFTLESGSTTVTVTDSRCRAGRLALVIPLNADAAGLNGYLSGMTLGSMEFTFTSAPTSDAEFGWALIGDGGN